MAVEKIERIREKWFKAKVAFGPYSKGALLKPTGIYRDTLLRKGFIEEFVEDELVPNNRQVNPAELANRGGKKKVGA